MDLNAYPSCSPNGAFQSSSRCLTDLTRDLEAAPGVDLEEEVAADEGEDLDGVLEDVLGGRGRLGGLGQDEEGRALRVRVGAATDAPNKQVGVDDA